MEAMTLPTLDDVMATMRAIADRAVITDIEIHGLRIGAPSERRYDVRPMLDEREVGPECVDMASEGLAYAIARGLVVVDDPIAPWLVRIAQRLH